MLHSYELVGKRCIGVPIFNHNCSKTCQVAQNFNRLGAKFSQVGQKLVTDAS
jgi:hypothetical protein